MSTSSRLGRWGINSVAVLGLIYLFAPIFVIILFSFNDPAGKFNIRWTGFTLDNWADPFAEKQLTDALWVSLRIAFVSTIISTILGSLMAIALSRYKFKGQAGVNLFLVLPLTSPEVVIGASLATLFLNRGVDFGYVTVIIAHVMFQISFVALTVRARIRGFDWGLEQAAMDLGASPMRAFWKITFPLILPGILAASLLSCQSMTSSSRSLTPDLW
jgi:spermidine/putrescine transport system permease protein